MALPTEAPAHGVYDVVIIGGAIHGSSTAWWLSRNPDFEGRILVVERDPSYEWATTSHTNSCIRQQFSNKINVQISQFGAEFIKEFQTYMDDPNAPEILLDDFGYLYLAADQAMADNLVACQRIQSDLGSETRILTPEEITARWPHISPEGLICGSHNSLNEGYFDGGTMFHWFRRMARKHGAEYIGNEVTGIDTNGGRATAVHLRSGERIEADQIVNACGPRGGVTAQMVGAELPVEARRRYTYIFETEEEIALPLTIDPSGCHMRMDGPSHRQFLAGCPPFQDSKMAFDDFSYEDDIWEEKLWPSIANRVPAFERVRVVNSWVGHYDYNHFDHNAVVGPHPDISNFYFQNGFSGHGLQQSPAIGRAMAELLIHGAYQTIDMSPFAFERIAAGQPFVEKAII